jgi:hypothetical protein
MKLRGTPHLAKNKRDVGFHGARPASFAAS